MNPEHNHLHDESGYAVEYIILGMASNVGAPGNQKMNLVVVRQNITLPGQ